MKNSIWLSFGYTLLNGQKVLFLTIQFNRSHLFAHMLNVKQFYLSTDTTISGATTPVRVDLGVMAMKGNSTFSNAPGLEFHHVC